VKRENKIVGVISEIGKWILTLAVELKWQHQGIGRELVASLPGKRYVYTSGKSVGFYEKIGFRKIFCIGQTIFLCRK
jgi:GNAT superfamily N-acetyltransferase